MRTYVDTDWQDSRGDYTHRTDLFTTEEAWPQVRDACIRAGVPKSQLDTFDLTPSFGLIRGSLLTPEDVDLGGVLRGLAGHNHLFGFGNPMKDPGDPQGNPKVWNLGDPVVADGVAFPPRLPNGPGTGITVGVVDTGYSRHCWVRGACVYASDDLEEKPTEAEWKTTAALITGHGLFVAGLVLEQAPGATVRLERVVSPDGHAEAIDVHDAICRLAVAGAQVINLSLGCYEYGDQEPFVLRHAIDWAREYQRSQGREPADIAFVASAGNNGEHDPARPFWPAAFPEVWAAAAAAPLVDAADGRTWEIAGFSSRSDRWVDVAAPGVDVLSCYTPYRGAEEGITGWAHWQGTSFSAAVVSGLLARTLATLPPHRRHEVSAPHRGADPNERAAELLKALDGPRAPVATAGDDPYGKNGSWSVLGTSTTARKGGPAELTVPR
jgi:hypothetical protein